MTPTGTSRSASTGAQTGSSSAVELVIGGMTCASCAARVEKKLNRMDGVEATVNYATEKAKVTFAPAVSVAELIATVEATGYTAEEPAPARTGTRTGTGTEAGTEPEASGAAPDAEPSDGPHPLRTLRRRLLAAIVLAVPVIAMSMVPALQFAYWQWLSLALTVPVVTYAAWPFHRAAWTNARHGAATMDTLISVGTSAAFLWSVWALCFGTAGMIGMTHPFELTIGRSDGAGNIYLEASAGVTAFLLAGRYFEARSKRKAGAALRALLELGAKSVTVLRPDGSERTVPTARVGGGRPLPGAARREDRHRRHGRGGHVRRGRLHAHRRVRTRRGRPGRRRHRRHPQRGRPARRRGHPGRRGHPARPDGPARGGRPERQGRRPAPRRPHLGRLRAGRHRARAGHPRRLARPPGLASPPRSRPPWPY